MSIDPDDSTQDRQEDAEGTASAEGVNPPPPETDATTSEDVDDTTGTPTRQDVAEKYEE